MYLAVKLGLKSTLRNRNITRDVRDSAPQFDPIIYSLSPQYQIEAPHSDSCKKWFYAIPINIKNLISAYFKLWVNMPGY
jgi:hypothetical protein